LLYTIYPLRTSEPLLSNVEEHKEVNQCESLLSGETKSLDQVTSSRDCLIWMITNCSTSHDHGQRILVSQLGKCDVTQAMLDFACLRPFPEFLATVHSRDTPKLTISNLLYSV
jgi:hypothetical protein